jgi:hypothetical protein
MIYQGLGCALFLNPSAPDGMDVREGVTTPEKVVGRCMQVWCDKKRLLQDKINRSRSLELKRRGMNEIFRLEDDHSR